MNSKEIADKFLSLFSENKPMYDAHIKDFGELLQHVFYSEVINIPLFDLLKTDLEKELIKKYVDFIEYMWIEGDESVKNVVDVTILERLSDDEDVWRNFGKYISIDFKDYINNVVLTYNCLMWSVNEL